MSGFEFGNLFLDGGFRFTLVFSQVLEFERLMSKRPVWHLIDGLGGFELLGYFGQVAVVG